MASLQNESNCWVCSETPVLVSSSGLPWKLPLANATVGGQLTVRWEDSHHLPVPHASTSERTSVSKHYNTSYALPG